MREPRAGRLARVAALALGGVVLGHLGAYLLAYPSGAARAAELGATGHGGFGTVAAAGLTAAAVAAVWLAGRAAVRRAQEELRGLAFLLVSLQVPVFLAMEAAERHLDLGRALSDPAVLLGVGVQVAVAVALAALIRHLARGVRVVLARLERARRPRAPRVLRLAAPDRPMARRGAPALAVGRRAPPFVRA